MVELSTGIIPRLFQEAHTPESGPVTLQATAVKSVKLQGTDRLRVKYSDGKYENQMATFEGVKVDALPAFAAFKMTDWTVIKNDQSPDKTIMQIKKFTLVKTPEEIGSKSMKTVVTVNKLKSMIHESKMKNWVFLFSPVF